MIESKHHSNNLGGSMRADNHQYIVFKGLVHIDSTILTAHLLLLVRIWIFSLDFGDELSFQTVFFKFWKICV